MLEEILKKVIAWNNDDNYKEVIDLLNDELLDHYKSVDLYSEKAKALFKIREIELCEDACNKALDLKPKNAKANYWRGNVLFYQKQNSNAIKCFKKAIFYNAQDIDLYNRLGTIYNQLKKYEEAEEIYKKALQIEPNNWDLKNALGDAYRDNKQFLEAQEAYNSAISLNKNFAYPHNGLGDIASYKKDYKRACEHYDMAIKIDPERLMEPYNNRAIANYILGDYENALKDYLKYLEIKQKKDKALNYTLHSKAFISSITSDYYSARAVAQVHKLKLILSNKNYERIFEFVTKIKICLLFRGNCITHYTTSSVTKALILEDSPFRLSEGTFLNDTAEGGELFSYLSFSNFDKDNNTIPTPFSRKPFIGSFVSEDKSNDLTMWRMYGKENKEEGKGCALTFDKNQLASILGSRIIPKTGSKFMSSKTDEDLNFYRVAYKQNSQNKPFIVAGFEPEDEKKFKGLMEDLKEEVNEFVKKTDKKSEAFKEVQELLNEIAYLFKNSDYQFEEEIRLVVKGDGIKKVVEKSDFSKVFIELGKVMPLVRKITLGPNVERADEWASTFYYSFEKFYSNTNKNGSNVLDIINDQYTFNAYDTSPIPDIFISHLAFK